MHPRNVGALAQEFEHWPLMPDTEHALCIPERRPPGYFDCNDICLPAAKESVEIGLQEAVADWKKWEEDHLDRAVLNSRFVKLPDGFELSSSDERRRQASRDNGAGERGVEESKESERPPPSRSTAEMEGGGTAAGNGAGAGASTSQEGEEKEGGGAAGTAEGSNERDTRGSRKRPRKPTDLLDGVPSEVVEKIFDLVPDFHKSAAELNSRLNASTLAVSKWKQREETVGAGMKDFRKLPFIRNLVNVVVVDQQKISTAEQAGEHAVLDEEALLTLTVFGRRNSTFYPTQDYTVLGRNTIGDLHRAMYCTLAAMLTQEAEGGNLPPELAEPSISFFFIEGRFYVMDKEEARPDHIDAIIQWIDEAGKDRRAQLGIDSAAPIEVLDMDTVTFADLTIRLGTRYLYCHLGDCEHHFSFTDMRLPHKGDQRDSRQYPLLTFQKHYRKRRCSVCDARPARYCAIMDPLGDEHKLRYCEFCHFQLHYDAEGQLVYDDFDIFPYMHED